MPKEFHRSERVSGLLHRVVSDIVRNEVRDPRLNLVTLTDLQLSRDLSVAKIYFTSMDDAAELESIKTVLNGAAGFIRSRVGREVKLRIMPELRFLVDEAELHGRRISGLINDVMGDENATENSSQPNEIDDAESGDAESGDAESGDTGPDDTTTT